MRFLPDYEALFLHVPRTGGVFVEKALPALGIRTSRWTREVQKPGTAKKHGSLLHLLPKYLAKVKFSFCFVRHPLSYYESVWRWLASTNEERRGRIVRKWKWHPFSAPVRLWEPVFSDWLEKMLDEEPAWVTRLFEMYTGPEGGEWVDFVGRQEHLNQDLIVILNLRLGMNCSVDQLPPDRTNARPMKVEWREDLKHRILDSEMAFRRWYT